MTRKNILFVLTDLPWPLEHGGDQAVFNNVVCIKNDYNVYCTYRGGIKKNFYDKKNALEKIWGNVKIYPFIEKEKATTAWGLFNQIVKELKTRLFRKNELYKAHQMVDAFDLNSAGFYDYVNKLIDDLHIDIVQIEMISRMNLVLGLPPSVKTVFNHHELRFVINDISLFELRATSYQRACAALAKIMEVGTLNQFDAVVTLSETDTNKLKKAGVTVPVYTSMAVVTTKPTSKIYSEEYHILTYIGPESHEPNVLAVTWFLERCWLKLLQSDDKYEFRIVGRWTEKTIKKIQEKYPSVEFTGFVDDLMSAVQNTISIIPLTLGSGIRMKILEVATIGVPFVSTEIGVEGLPFVDGEDCFITSNPEIFVKNILSLRDKNLRMKFIESANDKVKQNYSLESLRRCRISMYEEILKKQK